MGRKIVFVNGAGETFTADGTSFFLSSIDGIGAPATDVYSQKAPNQDGSTFIDALYQDRNIVCEIAINRPNNFTEIAAKRREAVTKLSPKVGVGTLTYTDESGASWAISAIPVSSPAFPNKDYREPYLSFQITFLCNDPYWRATSVDTIDLPTAENSAESVINAAASADPSLIQQSDGSFRIAYRRNSDGYLVQKTSADGTTWSGESVINSFSSYFPSLIQQSDGSFRIAYRLISPSPNCLVQRTSSDGITWSAESVINASAIDDLAMIQQSDGSFRIAYAKSAANLLVQRTSSDGSTWSDESTIIAADAVSPSLIQQSDGSFRIAYRKIGEILVQKTSLDGVTWSAESTISTTAAADVSLIQQSDGSFRIAYRRSSSIDDYLVQKTSSDGITWSAESVINAAASADASLIQQSDGTIRMSYRRNSTSLLVQITRSVTPVNAQNDGDVPCPVTINFTGPATNPRIIKQSTLEYIRLNITLAAADTMTINTAFGNKTITLVQGGITKNGTAFLDLGSTFFQVDKGANTVYFEDDSVASTATATMTWTDRYIGL